MGPKRKHCIKNGPQVMHNVYTISQIIISAVSAIRWLLVSGRSDDLALLFIEGYAVIITPLYYGVNVELKSQKIVKNIILMSSAYAKYSYLIKSKDRIG